MAPIWMDEFSGIEAGIYLEKEDDHTYNDDWIGAFNHKYNI